MKWRLGFLLCCAALITLAGASVASSPQPVLICCESSTPCPGSQFCCDPGPLGMDPCDIDLPGFCMEVCRRIVGTATFTANPR